MRRLGIAVFTAFFLLVGCDDGPAGPEQDALTITTESLDNAIEGRDYSFQLEASSGNGTYTWSISGGSLPEGLSLASSGLITGVATTRTGSTVTFTVTSDGATATETLVLVVDAVLGPREFCADFTPGSIAAFEDATLADIIRQQGDFDSNETTCQQLATLTRVRANTSVIDTLGGFTGVISSLWGVQNLTEVWRLQLPGGSVTDLSPLSSLTEVTHLVLDAHSISDLGPLAGLRLGLLSLQANEITDISVLQDLSTLDVIGLAGNEGLSDIQPLIDNPGMHGPFDWVYLGGTSVSCTDVDALEAKGVVVISDCP
jgi:hypothetical protein